MKNMPENELLSAYLDGELTAAEQADVERLLARDPAARQLLDELRALSSTLQALPQHAMPQHTGAEDLGELVLRTAQRRMLTEPTDAADEPAAAEGSDASEPTSDEPDEPAAPPVRPAAAGVPLGWAIFRRVVASRALAWSALAVAVAVMLTVMENDRRSPTDGHQIARAPVDDPSNDPTDDSTGGTAEEAANDHRVPMIRAAEDGERNKAGDTGDDASRRPLAAEDGTLPGEGESDIQDNSKTETPSGTLTVNQDLVSSPVEPPPNQGKMGPPPTAPDLAGTEPAERGGLVGRTGRGVALGMGGGMGGRPGGGMGGGMMGGGSRGAALGGSRAGRGGMGAEAPSMPTPRTNDQAENIAGGFAPTMTLGTATVAKAAGQTAESYAIVRCDLSAEAFLARDFDRLLAEQGINLLETSRNTFITHSAADSPGGQPTQQTGVDGLPEGQQPQRPEEAASVTVQQQQPRWVETGEALDRLAQTGELDLVCVEATHEQIEATLAALEGQANEILSLEVTPAIGEARQETWGMQYDRAARRDVPQANAIARSGGGAAAPSEIARGRATDTAEGAMQNDPTEEGRRAGVAWRVPVSQLAATQQSIEPSPESVPTPSLLAGAGGMGGGRGGMAGTGGGMAGGRGGMAAAANEPGIRSFATNGAELESPVTFGAEGMGQTPGAMQTTATRDEAGGEEGDLPETEHLTDNNQDQNSYPAQLAVVPADAEPTYRVLFVLRMARPEMPDAAASMGVMGAGAMGGRAEAPPSPPAVGQ